MPPTFSKQQFAGYKQNWQFIYLASLSKFKRRPAVLLCVQVLLLLGHWFMFFQMALVTPVHCQC